MWGQSDGVIFRKQTVLAAGSISGCAREQPIVAFSANGSIRPKRSPVALDNASADAAKRTYASTGFAVGKDH
jgi:hypothetical protein